MLYLTPLQSPLQDIPNQQSSVTLRKSAKDSGELSLISPKLVDRLHSLIFKNFIEKFLITFGVALGAPLALGALLELI